MRYSKISTLELQVKKQPKNTEELDGLLHLQQLKFQLIQLFALWKQSKLECKPPNQDHLLLEELRHSLKLNNKKVFKYKYYFQDSMDCIRDLDHYGLDKYLTQQLSLWPLNRLSVHSMNQYLLNLRNHIINLLNSQ